ncbi:MAG: hypothetical protein V4443_08865 [Pseudomonadota bacterium]
MNTGTRVLAATALLALMAGMYGCKKEGPAEQAGRKLDNAVEQTGKQVEKAGDNIKDAANGDKH